jgi:hypothetical protein
MKYLGILLFSIFTVFQSSGQLLMTKSATLSFHSHTFLEDVDAENNQVMAVIDGTKKNIAFSCLVKQFEFRKKLMQEHFNENYIESDKYPKATFSGLYMEDVAFDKDGTYNVNVKGKITLHGVTKNIAVPAVLTVKGTEITGNSTFKLNPADFNISIPFIVRDKIEKENTVNVKVQWTKKY